MDEEKNPLKKKRNNAGFTLAETLMAMLIMLMVTAIVAAGIPVARNAYEGVVLASNSELLLSTTLSALRNELGTAKNIECKDGGKEIRYYNPSAKITSCIFLNDEKATEGIQFQRYAAADILGNKGAEGNRLVTWAASNKNLYVTYRSASFSNGIVTFTDISVNMEDGSRTDLATRDSYSIRVLSYE